MGYSKFVEILGDHAPGPFPHLPLEIILHIFEIAAEDCSFKKTTALTLVLVSRLVQKV